MPKDGEERGVEYLHWRFFTGEALFLKQITQHNLELETQWLVNWGFSKRQGKQFMLESWTLHASYQIQPDATVPDNSLTESRKEKQIYLRENG